LLQKSQQRLFFSKKKHLEKGKKLGKRSGYCWGGGGGIEDAY